MNLKQLFRARSKQSPTEGPITDAEAQKLCRAVLHAYGADEAELVAAAEELDLAELNPTEQVLRAYSSEALRALAHYLSWLVASEVKLTVSVAILSGRGHTAAASKRILGCDDDELYCARQRLRQVRALAPGECPVCGERFAARNPRQMYCSPACRQVSARRYGRPER